MSIKNMNTIKLCKEETIPFTEEDKNKAKNSIKYKVKDKYWKFFNSPSNDVVYHEGYLNYLSKAWSNHYSVVMRPDDIWYIILNELTFVIGKDPKTFEKLFTTTPGEKQWVVVLTGDPETINPQLVVNALKNRVPSEVDKFIPVFTTSTEMSTLAMNVSFCDMVSPYYSYSTLLCGIPSIRIEGIKDDWELIINNLTYLSGLFRGKISDYVKRCKDVVSNIIKASSENNSSFFRQMVSLKPCGSGSQYEVSGWILRLLYDNPGIKQIEGLPLHMAKMDYTNLDTNRKFTLYCGLFYSNIENSFLIPNYDAIRVEDKLIISNEEEWDIGKYAKGSVVKHYGRLYKASKDTTYTTYLDSDNKEEWECLTPNKKEEFNFSIISSPVKSKIDDKQDAIVFANYQVKYKK